MTLKSKIGIPNNSTASHVINNDNYNQDEWDEYTHEDYSI
jgi:hypothetical protein